MPLFQKTPTTPEEMELGKPLSLSPDEVRNLDEDAWLKQAYRGDEAPQLTVRAAVMGSVLGFFLAFTNVYLGLKTGLHLGVALTACIVSFSLWTSLLKLGAVKTPMGILENNCMQSTASAAGFSTGTTLVSAIPALLMLSATPERPGGEHLPWPALAAWTFFLAVLGVTVAIPMKRNLINQEKLRFPSGTAAAVMLQSLYSEGATALAKARALLYAALASGVIPLLKDLNLVHGVDAKGNAVRVALLPGFLKIFDWLPSVMAAGKPTLLSDWQVKLDYSPSLIGAGALVGLRVTVSMIGSGLFLVLVLGPAALTASWTNPVGAVVTAVTRPGSAWREIGIWLGAPTLVSAGLLSFAFQWRAIVRTLQGLRKGRVAEASVGDRIEVPGSWFAMGGIFAGAGVVALARQVFGVPIHFGVIAVLLTLVLALVACRVTGESDVAAAGPMGKIMQLTYGILMPQNVTANLATAGITSGVAAASADLLTDLKAGYLLGANPRRQFLAQLLGVLPGTVATVLGFHLLVPSATVLMGEGGHDPAFPAPAAQQWKAVAQLFTNGIENLHPMARQCIFAGLITGAVLVLLERALPRYKRWLPSPTGIGLGLIFPLYAPLQMFLGAALAALAETKRAGRLKHLVVPISSGLIAGESIIGVVVAALNNFVLK